MQAAISGDRNECGSRRFLRSRDGRILRQRPSGTVTIAAPRRYTRAFACHPSRERGACCGRVGRHGSVLGDSGNVMGPYADTPIRRAYRPDPPQVDCYGGGAARRICPHIDGARGRGFSGSIIDGTPCGRSPADSGPEFDQIVSERSEVALLDAIPFRSIGAAGIARPERSTRWRPSCCPCPRPSS